MRLSACWLTSLQRKTSHVVTFDNLRGDHDASNTVYVAVKADLPPGSAAPPPIEVAGARQAP